MCAVVAGQAAAINWTHPLLNVLLKWILDMKMTILNLCVNSYAFLIMEIAFSESWKFLLYTSAMLMSRTLAVLAEVKYFTFSSIYWSELAAKSITLCPVLCDILFAQLLLFKDYANKAWPDIDLSLALVNKVKQFIDLYYQSVNLMFLLSNNKH